MAGQSPISQNDIARANHSNQWLSAFLLRFTGYTLLIFTLSNTIATIIPPQLMDPRWEFDTIGILVGQAPIPVIGLTLVFYGGLRYRRKFEKLWLRPLAYLAILLGIIFILMIPLGVVNSLRIDKQDQAQNAQQLSQQLSKLQQLETQVNNTPAADITQIVQQFQLQIASVDGQDSETIKTEVIAQLKNNQATAQSEAQGKRERQKNEHFKITVKNLLGALISGTCFIYIGYIVQKIYALNLQ